MSLKRTPHFCIGIDIASQTFVATCLDTRTQSHHTSANFAQTSEGYQALLDWLQQVQAQKRSSVVIMETTGIYGQRLCYHLWSAGYRVVVEDAARISRRAQTVRPKNDRIDSYRIAEYLMRFYDQVTLWQPAHPVLERLHALLTLRERLVKERTAQKNFRRSRSNAQIIYADLATISDEVIRCYDERIKHLDQLIRQAIASNEDFERAYKLLISIPGVQLLCAATMLVITEAKTERLDPRTLANYLGIAPHEHTSGSSIHKRTRSSRLGPPLARKLLHLAARSLAYHQQVFKQYYLRKLQAGKAKMLIFNNIANKLIRIICAVLRSNQPFQKDWIAVRTMTVGS